MLLGLNDWHENFMMDRIPSCDKTYNQHTKCSSTLADLHASSWDDGKPSSSLANDGLKGAVCSSSGSILDRKKSSPRPTRSRHLLGPRCLSLAFIALGLAAVPSRAALIAEVPNHGDISADTYAEAVESLLSTIGSSPPPEAGALLPLLSFGDPVSLPKGCFRSNDLLGGSSPNPWSPAFFGADVASLSPRKGSRSEAVVCPLGEHGSHKRFRTFAVSGVVEIDTAEQSDESAERVADPGPSAEVQLRSDELAAEEASWPLAGQDTGGYWRQRDGKLEWDPQPTEPMPLVAPQDVPASFASSQPIGSVVDRSNAQSSGTSQAPSGNEHTSAYNAWSASIGGEAAEEWLTFSAWKDRHLAAEKEKDKLAEAERRAERTRRAKQLQEQAASNSDTAEPSLLIAQHEQSVALDLSKSQSEQWSLKESLSQQSATHSVTTTPSASDAKTAGQSVTGMTSSAISVDTALKASAPETSQYSPLPVYSSTADSARVPASASSANPSSYGDLVIPAIRDSSSLLQTLRHRWNFASMDCAAVVHRTNPSAKFAASILSEKKDRYMLSPCPDISGDPGGNFVIVELCDEISIDTIVMANYEFFSRMFKRFKISASQTLKSGSSSDADNWYQLGIFRARNLRGVQVFNTTLPQTFAAPSRFFRYLRIDFLEYYGNEYYCPLSLLRVYGLTQMDDYRREEEEERKAREEASLRFALGDGEDFLEADTDTLDAPAGSPLKTADQLVFDLPEAVNVSSDEGLWDKLWRNRPTSVAANSNSLHDGDILLSEAMSLEEEVDAGGRDKTAILHAQAPPPRSNAVTSPVAVSSTSPAAASISPITPSPHSGSPLPSAHSSPSTSTASVEAKPSPEERGKIMSTSSPTKDVPSMSDNTATLSDSRQDSTGLCTATLPEGNLFAVRSGSATVPVCAVSASPSVTAIRPSSIVAKLLSSNSSQVVIAKLPVGSYHSGSLQSSLATHSEQTSSSDIPASPSESSGRPSHSAAAGAAAGVGGSSESIYRTIAKRLNALESNATLSLQYIEHSGQMLRDIFRAMERRQEVRLGEMLQSLNTSNWRQIEALKRRQQVELQRAIFEFDVHKQQTDTERRALLAEVRLLTTEVIFERRMGVVQLIIVLGLVVFMMITRGPSANPSALHSRFARLSAAASSRMTTPVKSKGTRAPSAPIASTPPPQDYKEVQGRISAPIQHPATTQSRADIARLPAGSKQTTQSAEIADKEQRHEVFHAPGEAYVGKDREHTREGPRSVGPSAKERLTGESMPTLDSLPMGGSSSQADDPPAGFADMSPTELKAYLGLDASVEAKPPSQQGIGGQMDETGDEGAETAMEALGSDGEHASEDFKLMMKTNPCPAVHWATKDENQPRGQRISSPSGMLYRRAASAEPGLASVGDVSPYSQQGGASSQGASPRRKEAVKADRQSSDQLSRLVRRPASSHQPGDSELVRALQRTGLPDHAAESDASDSGEADAADADTSGGLPWQSVPLRRRATQSGNQAYTHHGPGRNDRAVSPGGGLELKYRSASSVGLERQRSANSRKNSIHSAVASKGTSASPVASSVPTGSLLSDSAHANLVSRSASGDFVSSPVAGQRARQRSLALPSGSPRRVSFPHEESSLSSKQLPANGSHGPAGSSAAVVATNGVGSMGRSTPVMPLAPSSPLSRKDSSHGRGNGGSEGFIGQQTDWVSPHFRRASGTTVDRR